MSATIPSEIKINSETNVEASGRLISELQETPSQILHMEFPRIGFFPYGVEIDLVHLDFEDLIRFEKNFVRIQLLVQGGLNVINRITVFINHQPVQVNGADFIEFSLEDDNMLILDLEIEVDLESINQFNSLYAIMMTTENDYRYQDIIKSRSLLLVREVE